MRRLLLLMVTLLTGVITLLASPQAETDSVHATDPYEVSLEDNIATPEVPDRQKDAVRRHILARAKELGVKKLNVETLRRGEVFAVVIPSDELFLPNDTLLRTDRATAKLRYFAPFFKTHGEYKVIIVVHSDDTGSEEYRYAMTDRRVQSLYEWFDANFTHTENLFGYGVGSDIPLKQNDTAAGRRANRRVEIYVIPDEQLLLQFRKK